MRIAPARPFHERQRGARERGQAVARHVVRDREVLARRRLDESAGQRLARRERDRVDEDVERRPLGAQALEGRVDLVVDADVHRHHELEPTSPASSTTRSLMRSFW